MNISNSIDLSKVSTPRVPLPKDATPGKGKKLSHTVEEGSVQQIRLNFDRIDLEDRQAEAAEAAKSEQEREQFEEKADGNPVFAESACKEMNPTRRLPCPGRKAQRSRRIPI